MEREGERGEGRREGREDRVGEGERGGEGRGSEKEAVP